MTTDWLDAAARGIDTDYLVSSLAELARVSTAVPLGFDTLMEPDDPLLVAYVQGAVRPRLAALGVEDVLDVEPNDLVVRLGRGAIGQALLIQTYTAAQHHNLMEDPFSGRIGPAAEYGFPEPCVWGQGVSQCKAHQAVMLTVLKFLRDSATQLRGRLFWTVNNEARSTHERTRAILARLDAAPSFGVVQIGTGMKIWLGNRGRVDIDIHLRGRTVHSSAPEEGLSAIDGTNELLNRLGRLRWPDRHPLLGGRQAIAYKIRYEPLAPHTVPGEAFITVDRRLLPGDDPDDAVREVRSAIGDMAPYEALVERGVCMLPALTAPDNGWVADLRALGGRDGGTPLETVHVGSAFDAGGLTSVGIPAITFGAGAGIYPVGPDFVPISQVVREARLMAALILERLA